MPPMPPPVPMTMSLRQALRGAGSCAPASSAKLQRQNAMAVLSASAARRGVLNARFRKQQRVRERMRCIGILIRLHLHLTPYLPLCRRG